MKELSIEQKAKRYDEAIERSKNYYSTTDSSADIKLIGLIFPELKESEDEGMVKFIKKQLFNIKKTITENYELDAKLTEAIDWLEKQGNLMKALQISNAKIGELIEKNYYLKEQLEKQVENNMGISEATKQELEDNLNDALEKETPESCNEFLDEQCEQKPVIKMKTPEESLGIDSDTYNKIVDECVYGEQKHADKVNSNLLTVKRAKEISPFMRSGFENESTDKIEPKFKVGDFIVNDYCIGKVIELTSDAYLLDTGQGIPFSHEHNAHLWTIQDAKDGDVLAVTMYPEGTWIGIFKEYNGCTFSSYCFVNTEGTFKLGTYNHGNGKAIHPATKEQRDQLEKAMTDAGYTFDFDKKELKKIEQKPAWSEEDIELLDNTIKFIEDRVAATSPSLRTYNPTLTGKEIPFLKALKDRVQPKQEWSEEDEKILNLIIARLHSHPSVEAEEYVKDYHWFKAIKNRVQLQNGYNPYKEVVESIAEMCKHYDKASHSGLRDFYDNVKVKCNDAKEYDSLFPKSQWKPSDEQMGVLLSEVTAWTKGCPKQIVLESLYNDLLKLKS